MSEKIEKEFIKKAEKIYDLKNPESIDGIVWVASKLDTDEFIGIHIRIGTQMEVEQFLRIEYCECGREK